MKAVLLALCLSLSSASLVAAEATAVSASPPALTSILTVVLPDGSSKVLSAEALAALPQQTVEASIHDRTHRYAGADLRHVLHAAGAADTDALRGPLLHRVLIAEASDGYRVVFALAEIDPTLGARQVLLALRQDDASLPDDDGPLRLIVPQDKRGARSVRHLVRVVLTDLP
jgi:hypothetical protein